jgi:tetratricopeptide (TPR) repeat protein
VSRYLAPAVPPTAAPSARKDFGPPCGCFGLVGKGLAAILAALLLASATPANAAAREAGGQYRLDVVVHLAKHRLLTEVFRERLERELRDSLQAAFGGLARVDVLRKHDLLPEVLSKGLQKALDGYREREPAKTHFVLVDYAGLDYVLQARQYDGYVGQPSPVVRTERTRDRDFVSRAAALLIERDFGLTGTVTTAPDAQGQVKVELRGVAGVPLGGMVRKDDVFSLVHVADSTGPTQRVNWAFLQVVEPPQENATTCTCRLFTRYEVPSLVGDRCLKLGTDRQPLRLRLVRQTPGQAALKPLHEPVLLYVRRHGFTGEEATRLRLRTDDRDSVDTSRLGEAGLFDNLVFVTVQSGEKPLAQVPVPLLGGEQPVIVPVGAASTADDPLLIQRESWVQAVAFSYLRQANQFKEIQTQATQPGQRAKALETAQTELERSRADYSRLTSERSDLVSKAEKLPVKPRLNLAASDERLQRIKEGADELEGFIAQLQKIEKEENDPARKEALAQIERAKLLEREGEIGKALAIYEKLLKQGAKVVNLQQKVDELRTIWVPKNEKHAKARTFIFDVWPTLDNVGLKAHLEEARQALETCKKESDTLGPQKLLDATVAHGLRMEREVVDLKPNLNLEDEKPARLIEELTPQLERLAREIDTYLKRARADRP